MCGYVDDCNAKNRYWIQSQRKLPGGSVGGIVEPFESGFSTMACGNHFSAAVQYMIIRNHHAQTYVDRKDGVIVKMITKDGRYI